MRVVIIGGTGHVGTYLVPQLVEAGYVVTNVSRNQNQPYIPHSAWNHVKQVVIDREAAEADGTFGQQIRALEPDIVIDMICFTPESARQLVYALQGQIQHLLHCGTVWVHGHNTVVPTTEDQPRRPFGEYGIRKAATEAYLLKEARQGNLPITILHPGHIVGPGYDLINPVGNRNLDVFAKLARGEKLIMPNIGLETLHHVHAEDVAQGFIQAMSHWSLAIGEAFHIVSPAAITLRGYAEAVADWFDQPARLSFVGWQEWKQQFPDDAVQTWDHIAHSSNCSIDKAKRLLNYQPRYTSLEAIKEAVDWLIADGQIAI